MTGALLQDSTWSQYPLRGHDFDAQFLGKAIVHRAVDVYLHARERLLDLFSRIECRHCDGSLLPLEPAQVSRAIRAPRREENELHIFTVVAAGQARAQRGSVERWTNDACTACA